MSYEKVFGVGLNKTGTTTLADMLGQLGLRHQIWTPSYFVDYQQGKLDELISRTRFHDSFSDWPWPLMTKELLAHFGDHARFILTRRSCARTWVESLKAHAMATKPGNNARLAVYGYEYPQENEAAHLRIYNDHIDATRQLFVDNAAEHLLLDICWEDGDGWGEVANFLAKPVPNCALPHHNSRLSRRKFIPNRAANLERLGALVAQ